MFELKCCVFCWVGLKGVIDIVEDGVYFFYGEFVDCFYDICDVVVDGYVMVVVCECFCFFDDFI